MNKKIKIKNIIKLKLSQNFPKKLKNIPNK